MSSPSSYTVARTVTVHAPADRVLDEIADFHRWTAWSPWEDLDPALERRYSGPAAGPGSVYEWSGNRKAGAGRMEMTEVVPASRVEVALRFLKPFKSESTTVFSLDPHGADSTTVTWPMTGPRTTMVRLMSLVSSMDERVGKDFEKGLSRLRTVVESESPGRT
jgi:hypothetical protein